VFLHCLSRGSNEPSVGRDFERIMFSVDRFVYYPMRYPEGDWHLQAGSGAIDVWFKAADGVEPHAWWFPKPGAHFATLFLHGNAGNVTHRIGHAYAIISAGSSVLILDYRGYGKSPGRPTEKGLYRDADAGFDELLKRGYASESIVLHGESLGTAVATDLAARRACGGLILESPMISLGKMAGTVFPVIGPLFAHGFNTNKKIGRVNAPLLLIHGKADDIVPFSQGEELYRLARPPKTFWPVAGAHHNDLVCVAGNEYSIRLRAFYQSLSKRD
jgi:fermentation-respiration switch protein FrsA (DUF1100 family)